MLGPNKKHLVIRSVGALCTQGSNLKLRKHLQKMASESPQYVSIIERNGNILAAKSKPSFKQTFGVVQDSERYGGSLAVATLSLVNEVKDIFGNNDNNHYL